jgi:hypothetical protein
MLGEEDGEEETRDLGHDEWDEGGEGEEGVFDDHAGDLRVELHETRTICGWREFREAHQIWVGAGGVQTDSAA